MSKVGDGSRRPPPTGSYAGAAGELQAGDSCSRRAATATCTRRARWAPAKPFAVKKMITQDAEGAEVAELEVRVLEQLQTHAGIVGFHGWMKKEQGGKRCEYWMLLEYCPNGSLIDVLYRKGRGGEFERQPRLEQPRLLEIFEQVVAGVVHMHAQRPPVAHRDLKLENVLCSHSGAYVLCDFGSCSTAVLPAERTRKQVVEQEEAISKYSTLMYRAPEMVDLYLKHELGPKVDVWALGCILYALCYYDHPFASESTLQILNAGFAIPHDSALHFSPQIPALIKAMLTSDPARRPDAAEVLLVLGKLRKLPPPAPPPKAPAPPPRRRHARLRRRLWRRLRQRGRRLRRLWLGVVRARAARRGGGAVAKGRGHRRRRRRARRRPNSRGGRVRRRRAAGAGTRRLRLLRRLCRRRGVPVQTSTRDSHDGSARDSFGAFEGGGDAEGSDGDSFGAFSGGATASGDADGFAFGAAAAAAASALGRVAARPEGARDDAEQRRLRDGGIDGHRADGLELCCSYARLNRAECDRAELLLVLLRHAAQVEHVVAADEHLAKVAAELVVDPLLGGGELQVHVRVDRDEVPLVLHAPLQLRDHRLAGEVVEEGLRVDGHRRHGGGLIGRGWGGEPLRRLRAPELFLAFVSYRGCSSRAALRWAAVTCRGGLAVRGEGAHLSRDGRRGAAHGRDGGGVAAASGRAATLGRRDYVAWPPRPRASLSRPPHAAAPFRAQYARNHHPEHTLHRPS